MRMRPDPLLLQLVADGTPGGGTTVVLGLCEDVLKDGRWRLAFVSQRDSYALRTAQSLGVETFGLDFDGPRFSTARLAALWRLIRELRPALIHVHGARAGLPVALVHLLRREGIALVYTVHGLHFTMKPLLPRVLGALAEGLIARRADATVYVSNGDLTKAKAWHIAPGASRLTRTIFNGIEPADLDRTQARSAAVDLVFVGRLVRQKNPLFLADLMEALRNTDVTLGVVGGGELEADLRRGLHERGLTDRVTLFGKLDRSATIDVMRSARLCVFPSLWEGLPVTPIEASYLGIPVIASDIPGTDEVVIDGHNGVLVAGFDAQVYADHVKRLLNDATELEQLGRRGRELVASRFLRDRCSANYLGLYAELTGRRERRADRSAGAAW
jgi:glycosyltransferase involved in cell wall biosynthesis